MDCPKRSAVASNLPKDSLVEILARIPARSLCRSKCVAKAWRDVIEDPFHGKKLPQTLQGFFLITQERDTCGLQIGYASLLARSARLQIDPSLSFLTKLPGFKRLNFRDSCNGLLVFEHTEKSLGYVMCNPTTNQWGAVPRCGPPPSSSMHVMKIYMHLVFDPAVSSHFHLVQFVRGFEELDDDDGSSNDDDEEVSTLVNVYSSESGQWIHIESDWYKHDLEEWDHLGSWCAVLNGMLHFIIYADHEGQIAAVDVQGVTRRIIPLPITAGTNDHWAESSYVAQSQGCLHYINHAADAQLSIWVLEDYDTQNWVFKHSVSLERFGRMSRRQRRRCHKKEYSVVAMHLDANVIFIVQKWNRKLISYDMDHKRASVIWTLKEYTSATDAVVPYVPCFLESPALTNKLRIMYCISLCSSNNSLVRSSRVR